MELYTFSRNIAHFMEFSFSHLQGCPYIVSFYPSCFWVKFFPQTHLLNVQSEKWSLHNPRKYLASDHQP